MATYSKNTPLKFICVLSIHWTVKFHFPQQQQQKKKGKVKIDNNIS